MAVVVLYSPPSHHVTVFPGDSKPLDICNTFVVQVSLFHYSLSSTVHVVMRRYQLEKKTIFST